MTMSPLNLNLVVLSSDVLLTKEIRRKEETDFVCASIVPKTSALWLYGFNGHGSDWKVGSFTKVLLAGSFDKSPTSDPKQNQHPKHIRPHLPEEPRALLVSPGPVV